MIFTVGLKENYDQYIDSEPKPSKAAGGSVWRYYGEARRYLDATSQSEFDVYAVDADWNVDVESDPDAPSCDAVDYPPWCRLKCDAGLLRVRR